MKDGANGFNHIIVPDVRRGVEIVPAGPAEFEILVRNIRPIDRLEAETVAGMGLEDALDLVAGRSMRTRAGYIDGELVAIWGVGAHTVLSTEGTPWLLATNAMERREVRRVFAARSAEEFGRTIAGFRRLWNYVHAENRIAIRWLRWLGFEFPGHRVTIGGEPFEFFRMEVQ